MNTETKHGIAGLVRNRSMAWEEIGCLIVHKQLLCIIYTHVLMVILYYDISRKIGSVLVVPYNSRCIVVTEWNIRRILVKVFNSSI